ncbi:MAG: alkaline phosphatase family protein, partial [Armatimonadetes bacterium]|nr:alkaline phosphatase family protein [Anaerolineae bacterium]
DAMTPEITPNLLHFAAAGASTFNARSVVPPITLPCHTAIFHSIPPTIHGTHDNFFNPLPQGVIGLVEHLKWFDHRSAFIYNWEPLRDISRPGSLYISAFIDTGYDLEGDDIIAQMAIAQIPQRQTSFTFVYFASIDTAGHLYGWMSDGYLAQAQRVDALVGSVLQALPDDTTVIIHSDHGGHDNSHGEDIPEDMTIPWMIAGPNVKAGYTLTEPISLLDTAPTLAHVLGVKPHAGWQGRVVTEAFYQY